MSYKAVLFDWDGCLVQSLDVWQDVCIQALHELGVDAEPWEVAPLLGSGRIAKHFGVADPQACTERIRFLANNRLQHTRLYPGVLKAIRQLTTYSKLAIVSSSQPHILSRGLKLTGLDKYITLVINGESVQHKKPHPEGILKALHKLECTPREAVMIGDSINDIGAAQAAGVDALLFYPPSHKQFYSMKLFEDSPPTGIFTHFSQLQKLVT